ncbi:hypothetical protein XPN_3651, partial [Xanthomonas arboricola pv. pruni MAFF 301427]
FSIAWQRYASPCRRYVIAPTRSPCCWHITSSNSARCRRHCLQQRCSGCNSTPGRATCANYATWSNACASTGRPNRTTAWAWINCEAGHPSCSTCALTAAWRHPNTAILQPRACNSLPQQSAPRSIAQTAIAPSPPRRSASRAPPCGAGCRRTRRHRLL